MDELVGHHPIFAELIGGCVFADADAGESWRASDVAPGGAVVDSAAGGGKDEDSRAGDGKVAIIFGDGFGGSADP